MFDMKTLRERLLLSRRDLDINQDIVAERSGISGAYISKIERGRADNVGVKTIFALAQALGVSPAYLLGLTDNPLAGVDDEEDEQLQEAQTTYTTDPTLTELLTLYHTMSDDQRRRFIDAAKLLMGIPRIITKRNLNGQPKHDQIPAPGALHA